jgi:hypothetical protein
MRQIKKAYLVSPIWYNTKYHRLTFKGKYDGDGCVYFVSLSSKNKRDILKSKINFQLHLQLKKANMIQ